MIRQETWQQFLLREFPWKDSGMPELVGAGRQLVGKLSKDRIVLADIYELDLMLEGSEAAAPEHHGLEQDTWDRDKITKCPTCGAPHRLEEKA